MNSKQPSKARGIKSRSKLHEHSNSNSGKAEAEDNVDLRNSRKLCSTNHNSRSAVNLQLDRQVTRKNRQLTKPETNEFKGSGGKGRGRDGIRSDQSDIGSSGEETKVGRGNPHDRSGKKKPYDDSEHICDSCKFDSREEIFLKYKTEVLKTSFLKEQVGKLKQKYRNMKAEQVDKPERTIPVSKSKSKLFLALPIIQLSNRERSLFVQSQLSRLRSLIEDGQSTDRIGQSLNAVLIQLKQHIQDLQQSTGSKVKQHARVERNIKDYQQLLQKANQQVKSLKSKLKKVVRDNVQLQDQSEDQKQQLKLLKALVSNEKEHVRGTDHNFDKLHRQYTKLISQHEALLAKQDEIKHSNNKLVDLRSELESQFEKNLQELELANQQINFLKIQNEKHKHKKVEYQQMCERLQEELRELRQKSTLEKEKLSRSKHKLEEQYMSKAQQLAEAERLQQKTMTLVRQNDQLRKQLQYKTVQVNEAFVKVQSQQKSIISREDQYKKLLKQNTALVADLTGCRQQIEILREDISELKRTTENYKNRQLMKSKKTLFEEEEGGGHLPIPQERGHSEYKSDGKDSKLRALADIQSLIRRHRQQLD